MYMYNVYMYVCVSVVIAREDFRYFYIVFYLIHSRNNSRIEIIINMHIRIDARRLYDLLYYTMYVPLRIPIQFIVAVLQYVMYLFYRTYNYPDSQIARYSMHVYIYF